MSLHSIKIRRATADDVEQISDLYHRSRRHFLPYAPLVHAPQAVEQWIAHYLLKEQMVFIAERRQTIVGMVAASQQVKYAWIEQLYLLPGCEGKGIGSLLLEHAIHQLRLPIRLYTFQQNARSRVFYEKHGFEARLFSDGHNNEEGVPDVLYELRQYEPADYQQMSFSLLVE